MKAHGETIQIATRGKGTYEVTGELERVLKQSGVRTGILTVLVRHTSASLVIFENADRSARADLEAFFERLVPEGLPYLVHTAEGADDSTSHLRMALTRSSETIPVAQGRLQLGTWQGVYLFEHRRAPHQRELAVSVVGV